MNKMSKRMIITIILVITCIAVQENQVNAEVELEYKVKVGDVMEYKVVKLDQIIYNNNIYATKKIGLNRTIWELNQTYLEKEGDLGFRTFRLDEPTKPGTN